MGGSIREMMVLRLWRKKIGLRRMAGRRYEVLIKLCMLASIGRKVCRTGSGLRGFPDKSFISLWSSFLEKRIKAEQDMDRRTGELANWRAGGGRPLLTESMLHMSN